MYIAITKPDIGSPTKKSLIDAVIDNLADLHARVVPTESSIVNGSFELDSDADGVPDGWERYLYGGTGEITGFGHTDTDCKHGSHAYKFHSSGTGGGYLTSINFIEITPERDYLVAFLMRATAATLAVKVEALVYAANGTTLLGTYELTSMASSLPSAWTAFTAGLHLQDTTYALARFIKLRLTGGFTSSSTPGDVYFDAVTIRTLDYANSVTFDGSGTAPLPWDWICPAGVTAARITCRGGGGAGGSAGAGTDHGGGGGGGGGFAQSVIPLTPLAPYALSIGGGGVASLTSPTGGGDTTFAVSLVVGKGGSPGANSSLGTGGAGGIANTGHQTINGLPGDLASTNIGGNGASGINGKNGGRGGVTGVSAGVGGTPPLFSGGAGGGGAARIASTLGGVGGYGSLTIEY